MYPAAGSDIFVYPRGLFGTVPPFAIGRGYWDNWLIRRSVELEASVIDATGTVVAVHQDHDYRHVSYVHPDSPSEADVLASAEGQRNLALAGGRGCLYTGFTMQQSY